MTLLIDGKERNLIVSGTYSDITNGGKTAKAAFTNRQADTMWSVIYIELNDKTMIDAKISEYTESFQFAKISGIDDYIKQTFGSTIGSIGKASSLSVIIALILSILVTLLFMKMLIAKDRYSIAIMKSLGFTNKDITIQYMARSLFVLIVGIVLGTLLANTLGELLASAVIASFGASSFTFVVNPLSAYLLCPLVMGCTVLVATVISTVSAGQIKITDNIKE